MFFDNAESQGMESVTIQAFMSLLPLETGAATQKNGQAGPKKTNLSAGKLRQVQIITNPKP